MTTNQPTSSLPEVTVAILSYNTAEFTRQAVQSVLDSRDVRVAICIVDNGSTDGSVGKLVRKFGLKRDAELRAEVQQLGKTRKRAEVFPNLGEDAPAVIDAYEGFSENGVRIVLLVSSVNSGFGRANNLAMATIPADNYFLLNSDAQVAPESLTRLLAVMRVASESEPGNSVLWRTRKILDNPGIISAQLSNPDGTIQRQGGWLPNFGNVLRWMFFLDHLPGLRNLIRPYQHTDWHMRQLNRRSVSKVGWVGGTAVLIQRACLEEIGGFDPQLFMYGEDVELCWRAQARHWDVALVNAGKVIHYGSASSDKKTAVHGEIKGLLYLWEKHRSPFDVWWLKRLLRLGLRTRAVIFGILRQYGRQRHYQEALELV